MVTTKNNTKRTTKRTVKAATKSGSSRIEASTGRAAGNLQEELGKRHPFELPEEEVYLNLARSADQLAGEVRNLLQSYGLSEPMYNALRIVGARGQSGIPSQSIAHDMVCRSPDMTSLVDRLCKAELVERERSKEDRRVVMVKVTSKGIDMLAKLKKPSQNMIRAMLSHLSTKQLATLNHLLFLARTPPDA